MDTERWLPVPGYPTLSVSSQGRLRGPRGLRKWTVRPDGYLWTKLVFRDKLNQLAHRVVAAAFFGPPSPGMCVAHKNGIRTDNRVENLQYTSSRGNAIHCNGAEHRKCPVITCLRRGPKMLDTVRGEDHGNAKITEAIVLAIHAMGMAGVPTKQIASTFKLKCNHVGSILAGRLWSHLHPDISLRPRFPNYGPVPLPV